MYFVHPQIKFTVKNLIGSLFCFLKKPSKKEIQKIEAVFPDKKVIFTDMGRTAFRLIIEQLQLQNSKMIVPAFICDIFYPIFKEYKIFPVFSDISRKTFNIEPDQIEKILEKENGIKSIILVHAFGKPANLEKISSLAKTHGVLLIEDCAHDLGNQIDGKYLGNFGDASFFSLYKLFPCLRGGIAVLPASNPDIFLKKTKFSFRDFISLLNCFPLFAFLFKKFANEISPKYIRKEKSSVLSQLNKTCFNIFLWQAKNIEAIIEKRKKLALFFQIELEKMGFETQNPENNSFTFLSALAPKNISRDGLVKILRKKGIFSTRIWHAPIILNPEVKKEYNISISEFPNAIEASKRIVNFPLQNFYIEKDIQKIIEKVKNSIKELGY